MSRIYYWQRQSQSSAWLLMVDGSIWRGLGNPCKVSQELLAKLDKCTAPVRPASQKDIKYLAEVVKNADQPEWMINV